MVGNFEKFCACGKQFYNILCLWWLIFKHFSPAVDNLYIFLACGGIFKIYCLHQSIFIKSNAVVNASGNAATENLRFICALILETSPALVCRL